MTGSTFVVHPKLSPDIVSQYDGFILDQFGVLHNGRHPLPGAVECVSYLASMGKRLVILSNTSSPADSALRKLSKMGFDPAHFEGAVTSGEEASRHVRETYGSGGGAEEKSKQRRNSKAFWFTWSADNPDATAHPLAFLGRCGHVTPASSVDEADFVLVHGTQVVRGPGVDGEASVTPLGSFKENGDLSLVEPYLQVCLNRDLPMVCCNPDFVVKLSSGDLAHMPGKIARRYEEMGGKVASFGKPHVSHFEACLRELGAAENGRSRVVHVGDSLHHDVAGANAAGIDCVFVTGGIHHDDLMGLGESMTKAEREMTPVGIMPEKEALAALFKREGIVPKLVVPMFQM